MLSFLNTILSAIFGKDILIKPYILKLFLPGEPPGDEISYRITNTSKHSLKTDLVIVPIVNNEEKGIIQYSMVLNPGEVKEECLKGDYRNIRYINSMHNLNSLSYRDNKQPVKFFIRASFRDSRLKVMRLINEVENIYVFVDVGKKFERIK